MADTTTPSSLFPTNADQTLYAEVIIPLALPKNYTWAVPRHLKDNVKHGSRVEVQLKNKRYSGIVKTIHANKPAAFEPRDIINVLDDEPLIYHQQLKLWEWMA